MGIIHITYAVSNHYILAGRYRDGTSTVDLGDSIITSTSTSTRISTRGRSLRTSRGLALDLFHVPGFNQELDCVEQCLLV
jgi:hypothetical protein